MVFAIDVMHHVSNPRKMAREMMRVSSKYIFLIEANGICIIRKVMERISKKYQAAGENSYKPWDYKSFFKGANNFSIRPFLFMIPFTPKRLMKPVIWLSETMEKIPLLRWQGSGVVMCGEV
ncbi:hypothetical protein KY320_03740 [Candidatus Woesearchaeota archaeon]|nr:hypothetical protein [Candidatus Woesearchaeota archaeon]